MDRVCCRLWGLLAAMSAASASADDLRPGMALPPEQLTPEAARYEALPQGEQTTPQSEEAAPRTADEVLLGDDTEEKRRQFDDRLLHLGVTLGIGVATPTAGLFVELDVWDRLAIGGEVALSLWGPAAALHVRGRPLVWGGRRRGALYALRPGGRGQVREVLGEIHSRRRRRPRAAGRGGELRMP